jgi:rhodanese-related sulfurtransferase
MKTFLFSTLPFFLLVSCQGTAQKGVQDLTPKAFAEKIYAEQKPQLIDVRTPQEFAQQHLDGAQNIDWNADDFSVNAAKLDKSRPVYVYCKVGGRSSLAGEKLAKMGFGQVYNLQGGIMKWNTENPAKSKPTAGGMTVAQYNKTVGAEGKVLISFYAKWCAPCKKMAPYMETLEQQTGIRVLRLDADIHTTLVDAQKISGLPTLILYEQGKVKWKHSGFISEEDLKKKLK